jgi:hypothetical protein
MTESNSVYITATEIQSNHEREVMEVNPKVTLSCIGATIFCATS